MFTVTFKQHKRVRQHKFALSFAGVQRHLANKFMELADNDPDYKPMAHAIRTSKNIHDAVDIFRDYWDHRLMGERRCKVDWSFDGREGA